VRFCIDSGHASRGSNCDVCPGLSPGMQASAQDATAWDTGLHAAARLIAGSIIKTDAATFLRAGIEIQLEMVL
jgi:hypothetical protein